MSIFNAAGIYVILDVNSPLVSLNRADPASSYNLDYLKYIFAQVDNFAGYPNTLAFFAANEVINDLNTATANPPYIRVSHLLRLDWEVKTDKCHRPSNETSDNT